MIGLERVVVTENGEVNLNFEEAKNESLSFRCFLPPSVLQGLPDSKMYIEGGGLVGTGSSGGQEIDITNQEGDASTTGNFSDGTSSGGRPGTSGGSEPGISTKAFLEDVVYGQLVENGRPIGGERVRITWLDGKNATRIDEAVTLTAVDARNIGMPQLEGYYFLYTPPSLGFTRIVEVQRLGQDSELALSVQENTTAGGTTKRPYTQHYNVVEDEKSNFETLAERTGTYMKGSGKILLILALLLLLAGAGTYAYFASRKKMEKLLVTVMRRQERRRLNAEVKKLLSTKLKELAITANTIVSRETSLRATLSNMLHEARTYALVTGGGKYQGIITCHDILTRKDEKTLDATPAKEVMHARTALEPNASLADAITALKKEAVIAVVKNEKLIGAITRERVLELLDEFFSMHIVEARGMPRVRDVKEEGVTANADDSITTLLDRVDEGMGLIMVTTTTREGEAYVKRLDGIISRRALLDEIYNYSGTLEKMTAERLMERQTRGLTEGTTLLEGNKVLLERKLGAVPVLNQGKVLGVLTEKGVLTAIHAYLRHVLGDQKS